MPKPITKSQKEVFDSLKRLYATKGYMPTVREISADIGRAPSSIHQHLRQLELKGYIKSDGFPRGISFGAEESTGAFNLSQQVTHRLENGRVIPYENEKAPELILPIIIPDESLIICLVSNPENSDIDMKQGDVLLARPGNIAAAKSNSYHISDIIPLLVIRFL